MQRIEGKDERRRSSRHYNELIRISPWNQTPGSTSDSTPTASSRFTCHKFLASISKDESDTREYKSAE